MVQFELNTEEFLICLRRARRGAAAGQSVMTSDHLFPVLESDRASDLLTEVAGLLSVGRVPDAFLQAIRLGRLTAGGSHNGKKIAKKVEAATAPFQYALKTKAGCECVVHVLQTLTDTDPDATVMSIDGVGAYDLISRNAMLEGLLRMKGGDQILLFVRCFLRQPIHIFLGRRDGCHSEYSTRGGRGARRSPHAYVVRVRTTRSTGSHTSEDESW